MPTRCASLLTTTTSETVMSSRRCKRYCRTSHMTWPARRRYFDDHRAEHRLSAAAVGHQNSHQRTPIDWYETKPIISTEQLCLCIQNRINVSRLVPLTEIPNCLQKEKKQLLNIFLFILGTSPFKGSQSGTWNNFGGFSSWHHHRWILRMTEKFKPGFKTRFHRMCIHHLLQWLNHFTQKCGGSWLPYVKDFLTCSAVCSKLSQH